jgi:hypothetical protein
LGEVKSDHITDLSVVHLTNQRLNATSGEQAMSRHHILPPIIYTPEPPKPKEARRKRGVGYARGAGLADETDETEEAGNVSRTTTPRAASPLPQHSVPVDGAERRVPSPNGKLSDDTLKAMLEVQEKDVADAESSSLPPRSGGEG